MNTARYEWKSSSVIIEMIIDSIDHEKRCILLFLDVSRVLYKN